MGLKGQFAVPVHCFVMSTRQMMLPSRSVLATIASLLAWYRYSTPSSVDSFRPWGTPWASRLSGPRRVALVPSGLKRMSARVTLSALAAATDS